MELLLLLWSHVTLSNMRNTCAIAFFCSLFLNGVFSTGTGKHEPARFSSFRAFSWVPIDVFVSGFWPSRSARFAAREILSIDPAVPFYSRVTSAWGTFWNTSENRYGMYYVHFEIRYINFPYTRYQCSAWVHWPPPAPEHLDGAPLDDFNFCVPF